MSATTDAMRTLLDNVKSGDSFGIIPLGQKAFDPTDDNHYNRGHLACNAYNSSLDAAKALHDTLLPDYGYDLRRANGDHFALVFLSGYKDDYSDDWVASPVSTSRAWLIAILEVLIAKETE